MKFAKSKFVPYAVAIYGGGILALTTFATSAWWQLISFSAISPVLVIVLQMKSRNFYAFGAVFFATWIVPTTYWYYNFMPPFLAFAASFGFALMLANLFWIFLLKGRIPDFLVLTIFAIVWAAFTFIRLRVPIMEDWWLPHLGYATWRNTGLLQIGKFGGEATIEFVILFVATVATWLFTHGKLIFATSSLILAIAVIIFANDLVAELQVRKTPNLIAVQSATGGIDEPATKNDIAKLKTQTLLGRGENRARPSYVVWPEIRIDPLEQNDLASFAKTHNLYLTFHTTEPTDDPGKPYKKVVMIAPDGRKMMTNYKQHIAPGESATSRKSSNASGNITAFICYDMHYPDIVGRMVGAKLTFVPLNDAQFGSLEKTFHLADMALRAVQTNSRIIAASTDGPTAMIDEFGSVEQILPYDTDGVLIR